MSPYLYTFLIFLAIFTIIGINVAIVDHLKDIEEVRLLPLLAWVNLNLLLILVLIYLLGRKFYKEWIRSKGSALRRILLLSFFTLFGVPVIFITSLAVVGEGSYLRVFTDESLKEVIYSINDLKLEVQNLSIPLEEKRKLLNEVENLENKTSNIRELVRQQKIILINFTSFFILTALVVLFGGFLVASWFSRIIANEVKTLSQKMESLANGNTHSSIKLEEFPRNKIKELRLLAQNFNKLVEKFAKLNYDLQKKDTLSRLIPKYVSTGIALFNRKTGELIGANESYRKKFNFDKLEELKEWVKISDNITYKEIDVHPIKLVFIEDLTPYIVSKRYNAWKEIASRLAHDIKNPLQVIRTSLDFFEIYLEKLQEEKKLKGNPYFRDILENFKRSENQIKKSIDYITDLIDSFNNLSSQEENLKKEKISLRGLLYEIKNGFETPNFKIFIEMKNNCKVYADKKALRSVFENLIRNAYEAITNAGIPQGEVRIFCEGNKIHIVDNGPGIPPEKAQTIFLPFTSSKGKGRGLGLFIAKKLIEEHGWNLKLIPSEKGAHFVIEINPGDMIEGLK